MLKLFERENKFHRELKTMPDQRYITDFCTLFYEITNCPISLYEGRKRIFVVPEDPFSLVSLHEDALWKQEGTGYTVSESGLFFARLPINKAEMSLVIGPFVMNFLSEGYVQKVISEYGIISINPEVVADYLHSIASGVFSKAVSFVRLAYFTVMGHLPETSELFQDAPTALHEEISTRHTKALVKLREEEEYHNTYNFERMVFSRIQKGDVEFFRSGMRSSAYKVGKMADTSLRQEKNTFIVSVALATRSAVAGGLDEEIAYQLSDEYIQTVESMVTLDSIDLIQRTMLIDFAERVRDASLPLQDIPEDIARSIKYIRLHTNSNLSVHEVADAVGLSRSHLSHKFKEAMGFDISAFMMRCRLEEAKSLLMYSEQSISEISNYLCFSSQSYFTSVFRQKYGLTPKEYRMQFGKEFNL